MSILGEFERIVYEQTTRLSHTACECGCPAYCHEDGEVSLCRGCGPCMRLRGLACIARARFDEKAAASYKAAHK